MQTGIVFFCELNGRKRAFKTCFLVADQWVIR
jgi:hypothetical protein